MKFAAIVSATAFALALGGNVLAEDTNQQSNQAQTTSPSTQNQPAAGDATAKDAGQRDRDYQAEVKKCDKATDKQKCLDTAKKSQGNM